MAWVKNIALIFYTLLFVVSVTSGTINVDIETLFEECYGDNFSGLNENNIYCFARNCKCEGEKSTNIVNCENGGVSGTFCLPNNIFNRNNQFLSCFYQTIICEIQPNGRDPNEIELIKIDSGDGGDEDPSANLQFDDKEEKKEEEEEEEDNKKKEEETEEEINVEDEKEDKKFSYRGNDDDDDEHTKRDRKHFDHRAHSNKNLHKYFDLSDDDFEPPEGDLSGDFRIDDDLREELIPK